MKKNLAVLLTLTLAAALVPAVYASEAKNESSGEALFKAKCAACHPDGGNIITPSKTLKKKDLAANKLTGVKELVAYMRKPGPGMNAFDAKSLPDKDAKAIATFVLKTFK